MRYLSMFGSEGFRTFRGILNGRQAYVPESIPKINPEITTEREYFLRLQEIISPYTDNHPKLKDVLPVIPENVGVFHEVNDKYAIWMPKNHLSLLGQHLIAGFLEQLMPEEFKKPLSFVADIYDSGLAFADAFSIEKKKIYVPSHIQETITLPKKNDQTDIIIVDNDDKLIKISELLEQQTIRFDAMNTIRIIGHMATIVQALYESEKTRFRFYKDPVSIALPADDIEFLLAGYYLTKSDFPIQKIYAVSSHHRVVHNFLSKGEFSPNGLKPRASYLIPLFRMLFEASHSSVQKNVRWRDELRTQGSFKIDSTTNTNLQKVFTPVFATKNIGDIDTNNISVPATKLNRLMYKIAKEESREQIIAFDLQNPTIV